MFEKVNPMHPDKLADRIAGALVDLAYDRQDDPRIAVEVLLGHGSCRIIAETSVHLPATEVVKAVGRIAGKMSVDYIEAPQDGHLADNQRGAFRCGDNGIFKGMPVTDEQRELTEIATELFSAFRSDGKYVLDGDRLIICQSNAKTRDLKAMFPDAEVNPLGDSARERPQQGRRFREHLRLAQGAGDGKAGRDVLRHRRRNGGRRPV